MEERPFSKKNLAETGTDIPRMLFGGYLTVETAMIMPVLLFSVLMLLYLTAHVHNRTCLFAGAAEQAVSGHVQEDPELFAMAETACSRKDSEKERKVRYTAGTLYLSGERLWSIDEEAVYKKYRPVKQIRKLSAAKRLTGQAGTAQNAG